VVDKEKKKTGSKVEGESRGRNRVREKVESFDRLSPMVK
jgi:hypothetical protein